MLEIQCAYCNVDISDENYLHCDSCGGDVHVKCLRNACTPGDLAGDVFFDFICARCMQLRSNMPSTSKHVNNDIGATKEKFVRQRMPWLLIITMALYNLSIKSKGLSRHGYFHWKTHIINFIDKNWDFLFDSTIKRRKKWTGSISGALSHNSPKYFTSGQELFEETGWWKLTHENRTPKHIFNLYEQECLKRQQIREDKRHRDDSYASDTSTNDNTKHFKHNDSDNESCSRTTPYMGRKTKNASPLNVLDDKLLCKNNNNIPTLDYPVMPLNKVQSSLMDFLAENLASDDMNFFNNLPNMTPESLVASAGKTNTSPLHEHEDNAQCDYSLLIKPEALDLNGILCSDFNAKKLIDEKSNSTLYPNQDEFNNFSSTQRSGTAKNFQNNIEQLQKQNSSHDNWELSNDFEEENSNTSFVSKHLLIKEKKEATDDEENSDPEEFQPRIVQVTNFQPLLNESRADSFIKNISPKKIGKLLIKQELTSNADCEESYNNKSNVKEESDECLRNNLANKKFVSCKDSLFTKQEKRPSPWLIEDNSMENVLEDKFKSPKTALLTLMSEYEEKELLQKLRKIFEAKSKLNIPSYIQRFYRKLVIREWNREHGKRIFNLDDYVDCKKSCIRTQSNGKAKIIERYQLITLSATDSKKPFYARIAGSSQHELFQSPYTQRILHPFIYRNRECCPPFLKLMCELQHKVNGYSPTRAPIDYCYVRPNHIAAVNALLQNAFWPGIDMSECLTYPDFSVVALYKNLVIGCGFLVPDVGFNEAYISFMAVRSGWQRSGIATFMLYHLIQTCMTKDITLHVSATNPAVVLYQKFGFKIEEIILNFYDKYLPFESKHSRTALFLRLMR